MNNLTQSVGNETMSKLVSDSEAKNEQGMFSSPFASASSSVRMNVDNEQQNETRRKLSNAITNTVANNVKTEDIKNCFLNVAQSTSQKVGNVRVLGDNNHFQLNMSSKQLSKSFASCQQLSEQTSSITNSLAAQLGLTVKDDTKNVTKTTSVAKSSASTKTTGLEGVISAIGDGIMGMLGPIIMGIVMIGVVIALLAFLMKKKGGGIKKNKDGSLDFSFGDLGTINSNDFKSKDKGKGKGKGTGKAKSRPKRK
jgi:hypothetical protein